MVRLKVPGRLAWAAAALAAFVGAAVVLVHTPPAARWGRDWLVRQVATRWQLDLATSRLDINLAARRFTLHDIRLSAPGHADAPFFSARRLSVVLPWATVQGVVQLTTLDVDDARVWLVRERGTIVNLPPSSGQPPPAVARRLDIRGLQVRGLDVDYEDRTGDVEVSVKGIAASLDERARRGSDLASGTLRAARVDVRMGDRNTTSGALDGRMGFDGSNVSLQALAAPFPEGRLVADGRINRVLDDTHFALTLQGTLDYARIASWTPPPTPVAGSGTFTGAFTGPLGGYLLKADFVSPALRLGRASGLPLTGTLTLTSPRAVIDPFRLTAPATAAAPRDGIVEGRFTYEFGRGTSDLEARFRELDLDTALAAYDKEPMTFAAWQQGTATVHRDTPQAPMVLRAAGTSRALTRADRVAVDGTWTAALDNDHWVVRHDHRLLDTVRATGTMAWTAADDPAKSRLSGPLALDITNVGPMVRAARGSGIDLSEWLMDVRGPAQGALVMDGSLAQLVLRGRVASSSLVLPTGAPATAAADIVYDGDSLRATTFELTTPGARMTGDVVMGMESGRLAGTFDASADDLPRLAAPFAEVPALSGTLRLQGTIGGTTDVPDVPFTVRSTPLLYDTQRIGDVEADAHLRGTTVEFSRLAIEQGPGRVTGTGRVDYLTGDYDVSFDGRDLSWTNPRAGAPVESLTMQLAFAGRGTFAAPGGSGSLVIAPVGGSIGDLVGNTDVRWQLSRAGVTATAFLPKLRAWTQATIAPTAPYEFRGVAAVSALDVQPFALAVGTLPQAVTGTVGMSASYDGRLSDLSTAQAFVNLQNLALLVGGLPVTLDRPARITARMDDFSVDDLALRAGGTTLTASGRFHDTGDRPLRAELHGSLADVVGLGRAVGALPDVTATGGIEATWESRGGLERAQSRIVVSNGWITPKGVPPLEALETTATFDGRVLTVDALSATWQGAAVAGSARVPRAVLEATASAPAPAAGRIDLTVKGITQRALSTWLPADTVARTEARVSATLGLDVRSPTLDGVRGSLVLDEASVTAAGVPITQVRPARMSIDGRTLSFDDVAFSAGAPVVIAGTATFAETTALDLRVTGTPGLRPFSVLSPSLAMDGAAAVDLRVTGTANAPRVTGRIDLDDAEAVMRDPRVIASDISGPILFEDDRVSIPALKGFLNGGDFEVSGAARVLGVDVASGEFTFQARGVAVEYPQNVDSEIDALLSFRPGPGDPVLRGDVRVLRGAYRATISLPALVAFNATRATVQAQPSYMDRLRLDLAVTTEDDIVIDNNYGRFEAGANVRLQGTGTRPSVTGRAELREGGEVFVLGGLYRLNQSTISFTNPNAIEPDMSISMVTRSNGAEQTLTLSGTLDRLQTSVVSSDPNANTSVAGMLLGGDLALDRTRAVALLSGELLGVTGRAIGLDSLRVERGFNADDIRQDPGLVADIGQDPATRLTLSKQLRPDVEVVLSQGIGEGKLSGYVTYRPYRGVEVRGTSLDNTDRLLSLRHDISFGGTPVVTAAKRVLGEVASVTLDGAPAADEPALRARLKLTAGKRFDFIQWRDDVERLRSWYRERGFLEARVRASRAELPGDRIAITYQVQRGPATELQIDGMAVSSDLRKRLEATWADSVFDRFLLEEIKGALWFELVRQNIVNAQVEAAVESTTPVKVIRATARNGQAAKVRRITFTGASALTPAQLEAEVKVWGLADYGWLAPQSIADALSSRYASEGYHAAAITAAEPVVIGDDAVLAVTIVEGPLSTVLSATLRGDDQPLAEATRPLAAALEGHAYKIEAIDVAARQIESRYRAAGYNDVAVRRTIDAPADSTSATVVFDVEPGRQQRLAEVVVTGADRTRPGAVKNALGLDTGDPVNLTTWAQARKRVFDTNVFRQVDVRPEVLPQANADGSEAVRANVTVTEWPTWRLRYGLQFDDRSEGDTGLDTSAARRRDLGVIANLQNRNVFGRAWTFGVSGLVARRLQSSNTYLTFPTLFGRAVQTNVFAASSRADRFPDENGDPLIRETKTTLSLEQRVRRGRSMEIVYGYRVIRDVQRGIAGPDDPFYLAPITGRFTGSALFDRRDDPFNARRGWFASATVERVSEFESNSDSIKVLGRFYRYQQAGPVTLASAVRLGTSFLDPLLVLDPFYVGGADTVRGYLESRVGPRNFIGIATGGNASLILNQEVRAPIYKWIRGVAFVDAGNVFASNSSISLSNLEVGYGVGLRLHTPFSILRVDLGYPASGTRAARWYFGLGHIF